MISSLQTHQDSPHLLAIDLGLRLGWSCFQSDAQLIAYGSHHCGQANKLNALSYKALKALPLGSHVIIEGNGRLLKYWTKNAAKFDLDLTIIHAERWRATCLSTATSHDGKLAKNAALKIAHQLIRNRAKQGAVTLRHDAAEACLIGWWGLHHLGWISDQEFHDQLKV